MCSKPQTPSTSQDQEISPISPEEMCQEDGMVSYLPPQAWLYLTDEAQCYHRLSPARCPKQDVEYAEKFLDACRRKYSTLILTWRWLLDYEGVGRVTFQYFSKCVRDNFGFKEPKRLWAFLNTRRTSFLTLDEWDPLSFRNLFEFRSICLDQYGGMETAFKFGMDHTGSRTCTMAELERFCDDHEFSGDTKALFDSLDMRRKAFLTLDDLNILVLFEGHKHGNVEQQFDFQMARLNKKKQLVEIQKAKVAVLPPRTPRKATKTQCDVDVPHVIRECSEEVGLDDLPLNEF